MCKIRNFVAEFYSLKVKNYCNCGGSNLIGVKKIIAYLLQRRHLRGAGGAVAPPRKRKKERKKEKKEKEKKVEKRKKGTMNNVKLLHIKGCFFQFFNSQVALKNLKKIWPPKKKLKWRPWFIANISNLLLHVNIDTILFANRLFLASM